MTYRKSSWSFNTSAGAGFGLGPFSISRGMLVLNEPDGKEFRQFKYSTFGMGIKSLRLPERFKLPGIPLPRGQELSGSASTTDFWSDGIIFMNQTFHGRELTLQDFSGGVFVEDAGGGVLIAKNYTLMHVGIPSPLMLASFANPVFLAVALNAAKAIIIMEGVSEGLIDGAGITSSIGMLTYEGKYSG